MLPHPDMVRRITELHNEERRRDVAQQRRNASSKTRERSRPTRAGATQLAVGSWLTGWMTRVRGPTRVQPHGRWRRTEWDASFCRDLRLCY